MESSAYQQLSAVEQHTQWLQQGHQQHSRTWLQEHTESDHPDFSHWLSLRLRQLPTANNTTNTWPIYHRQCVEGWKHYYAGQYHAAAEQFICAWPAATTHTDDPCVIDIALGLGKTYTRSGHWAIARDWIIHSLWLARQHNRLFATTEGYGALGELFLRAGHRQAAQACMHLAYQLLPPGSGQQAKQLNYMASTAMRARSFLKAESLLMTALHMAHDQQDSDSAWHALARLQFLQLDTNTSNAITAPSTLQQLQAYQPPRSTPIAHGLALLGQSLWWAQQQQMQTAAQSVQSALDTLGQAFPVESIWAHRLHCTLTQQTYHPRPELHTWQNTPTIRAPDTQSVLDITWANIPLCQQNGFQNLFETPTTWQQERQARHLFFI